MGGGSYILLYFWDLTSDLSEERYYNPLLSLSASLVGSVLTCGFLPW